MARWLIGGIALVAWACLVLPLLPVTVDSDTLFAPLLFRDLFAWGGHLGEWNVPPAPCWFPDAALVWAALACGASDALALRIAAALLLGIGALGWVMLSARRAPTAAALATLFALCPAWSEPLLQIQAHGGVAALAPWLVWACRQRHLGLAVLLTVLLVGSDSLALPMLVLPLLLVLRGRRAVVLGLAAAGGYTVSALARSRPLLASYTDIDPTDAWRSLSALVHWLGSFVWQRPLACALLVIAIGSVLRAPRRDWIARFVWGAPLVTAATLVLFGQFLDDASARYLTPVLFGVPAYALGLATAQRTPRFSQVLTALALLAAILLRVQSGAAPPLRRSELLAPLERELAVRDLHSGVASYWDAKLLTSLSKRGTFLTALAPDRLAPYTWNANARWPLRFQPTFLFVEASHAAHAERLLGAPAERVPIDDHVLLTYASPEPLRALFAPYLVDFTEPGASAAFDVRLGDPGPSAYRGPNVVLPPGRYRIELASRAGAGAGSYRLRIGRGARAEGAWPAEISIDAPRPAPLLVEIDAPSQQVLGPRVTRLR